MVKDQCSGRNYSGIEVWKAQGTPSGSGTVTAHFPSSVNGAVIAVSRYSGVDPVDAVGDVVGADTLGTNDTVCSGGTDSSSYSANITTSDANHYAYGAVAIRNRTHTPGSSPAAYTERAEVSRGSSGNVAALAVEDRSVASASAIPVNGSMGGSTDWAMVGIEIKAASAGPSGPSYTVSLSVTDNDYNTSSPASHTVNLATDPTCASFFSLTSAAATKCNEVGFTWTAAKAASSYTLYRHTCTNPPTCSSFTAWDAIKPNITTLSTYDTTASPSSSYQYYLKAVLPAAGTLNNSTASPACTGTWSGNPPEIICPLSVVTQSCVVIVDPLAPTSACGLITLSWQSLSGATSYRVYRNVTSDNFASATLIASGLTALTYTDRDIVPDVIYYYYVTSQTGTNPSTGQYSKSACFRGSQWQEREVRNSQCPNPNSQ